MAKRPIVVDATIDSPLAAFGVNLAKDVAIPKANAPRLAATDVFRGSDSSRDWVAGEAGVASFVVE